MAMNTNTFSDRRKFIILFGVIFVIFVALAISALSRLIYEDFYEIEKENFSYIIHNNLPNSVVPGLHNHLIENRTVLLKYFNLNGMQQVAVGIWGDEEAYLSEQEREIGKKYTGSKGYVTLKKGSKPGELRLLGNSHNLPQAALHELVHVVTLEINPSFSNNPRWLWESIAIYKSERQWKYSENPDLIRGRFDYMAQSLLMGDTGAIYEIGFTIGEFIEATWGKEGMISLIKSNGDFGSVSEKSTDEIFLAWKDFVDNKYFRKRPINPT